MADVHQTLLTLARKGQLDVATFMMHALYHAKGYYARQHIWGRHGSYITAPHITQVFGEMVALWVMRMWQKDGHPPYVQLVELGPGDGTLLKDMLRIFQIMPTFNKALKAVYLVDVYQRACIDDARVHNCTALDAVPSPTGGVGVCYIVSNEFLDALPVQQHLPDGTYQHIDWVNNTWQFRYCAAHVKEICPYARHIINQIHRLTRCGGRMLAIDYGHQSDQYHPSTLQGLYRHRYVCALSFIGEADISCHVNWLYWMHRASGHSTITPMGEWLLNEGAEVRTTQLARSASPRQQTELWTGLARLIDARHMGSLFQVWEWEPKACLGHEPTNAREHAPRVPSVSDLKRPVQN